MFFINQKLKNRKVKKKAFEMNLHHACMCVCIYIPKVES